MAAVEMLKIPEINASAGKAKVENTTEEYYMCSSHRCCPLLVLVRAMVSDYVLFKTLSSE